MADATIRTITAKPNAESLIKPGELVDLVEVTPLTLNDRRIYIIDPLAEVQVHGPMVVQKAS